MNTAATLRVLVAMGVRNLAAHRVKSTVVGSIMFFGVFLVVLGNALLDSVEASMERSITSSLAGQAQVYSASADDELALFPTGASGTLDYGEIDDFPAVRELLLEVDNVADVVPMGITQAIVFGRPQIDVVLEELRDAVDRGDSEAIATYRAHIEAIAAGLQRDVETARAISDDQARLDESMASLALVTSDAFWRDFDADPAAGLQTLDTRIAPIAVDGRLLYLRVIGTDLDQFAASFESFELVEGQLPPPGEPGILLADRWQERQSKDKVARDLDALREGLAAGDTLADDAVLGLTAERLPKQVQGLLYQLSPDDAEVVRAKVSAELGPAADAREALRALLTLDDANFAARYALFYEVVAPRLRLYETPVGAETVLRAFTKSGYQRAAAVKVWGTFRFAGLEGSDLAGVNNLIDLGTFRTLYGRMTAAQQAELDDIRATVGVADISREDAEAALFGGAPTPAPAAAAPPTERAEPPADDSRLALNAAVLMTDPTQNETTIAAMKDALDAAGLDLKVVDWQQAAGLVGQIVVVLRAVLTVAIAVIFLVALVIINNTMVMATMERTHEIGTMRAIGAQRTFVIGLFVLETLLLGLLAGGLGALAAVGLIAWLGHVGIPAYADILVLLFAGKHLYPTVTLANVALGMVAIVLISVASALYPALLAARVQPVVAMQGKE